VIEAAYAIDLPEAEWLQRIMGALRPALQNALGAIAYVYDLSSRPIALRSVEALDSPIDPAGVVNAMRTATDEYIDKSWKVLACGTASEVPGYQDQPAVKMYFHPVGVRDILAVNAYDPGEQLGLWVGAPLPKERPLTPRERSWLTRLSAHLASALRLRTKVSSPQAVVAPSGKILHAEGDAAVAKSRLALRAAALGMDRARSSLRKSDMDAALGSWRALVAAQWSLVDTFEADGKRYLLARTNAPTPRGAELLSTRERQVLGYLELGHSTKLIAYELGISASTIRVLLARAARKLGTSTRAELLAAFRSAPST
jgi:DNA-binding CsgD family transcriptional regulator